MAKEVKAQAPPMRFQSVQQSAVPKGRDGKHKLIVTQLLSDIAQLEPETALKVPLAALPDTKENIRSALNRATTHLGIEVATSSDAEYLYIWKTSVKPEQYTDLQHSTLRVLRSYAELSASSNLSEYFRSFSLRQSPQSVALSAGHLRCRALRRTLRAAA